VSVAEVRRMREEQAIADQPAPAPAPARRRPITGGRRVSGPITGLLDDGPRDARGDEGYGAHRGPSGYGRSEGYDHAGREHDHLLVRDRAFDDDTEVRERRRQRRNRPAVVSWDDPWAVGAQGSAEPWAVAGEWWDEPRQAAADAARRDTRARRADDWELTGDWGRSAERDAFDHDRPFASAGERAYSERAYSPGPDPIAPSDDEPAAFDETDRRPHDDDAAARPRHGRRASAGRRRGVDLRAAWRHLYLVDSDEPSVIESDPVPRRDPGYDAAGPHADAAYDDEPVPMYDGAAVAAPEPEPADEWVDAERLVEPESEPELAPNGRRTVTITGRGDDRQWSPSASVQRPNRRAVDRIGYKPERVAMWAVLLGLALVLVAATSSHAAVLHAHHALAHLLTTRP
jgi:hypothetical protein